LVLLVAVPCARLIQGQWTAAGIATAVVVSTVFSAMIFLRRANRLMGVSPLLYAKSVLGPGLVPYLVAAPFAPAAFYAASHFNRWTTAGCVAGLGLVYSIVLIWVIARLVLEPGERLWFLAIFASRLARFRRGRTANL
jgi:hypothetical protein